MSNYIIYAIITVGIFTAYIAIVNLIRGDKMQARIRAVESPSYNQDEDDDLPPISAEICARLLAMTGLRVSEQKDVSLLLAQAGIPSRYAVAYFLFFKRFIQPLLFAAGLFVFFKLITTPDLSLIAQLLRLTVGGLLITAGLMGAKIYVTNRKQRRQQVLIRSFPEVLDLLLVCIESGLGVDAALARVCNEMRENHPVMIGELDRTRLELTLMSDRMQALKNLAERSDVVAIKSLVAALMQSEKFGTSLLETLRVLSDDMRVTRLMNAENRAARIPVLITIPLILCILPSFIMIILGPPIVRVIDQGGIFGPATSGR